MLYFPHLDHKCLKDRDPILLVTIPSWNYGHNTGLVNEWQLLWEQNQDNKEDIPMPIKFSNSKVDQRLVITLILYICSLIYRLNGFHCKLPFHNNETTASVVLNYRRAILENFNMRGLWKGLHNDIKHILGLERYIGYIGDSSIFHSFILFHSIHLFIVPFIHFSQADRKILPVKKCSYSWLRGLRWQPRKTLNACPPTDTQNLHRKQFLLKKNWRLTEQLLHNKG